jgi:hypothetical protein
MELYEGVKEIPLSIQTPSTVTESRDINKYSGLSIIRAWFNRFAAQPRQCIFKE